ncbi:MAG: alpha/beta hydrolase-fold protein [Candidatus Thorarchaeota archaeon]
MAKFEENEINTDLIPSPAKYTVMLPDDYGASNNLYPLILFLHGGDGDRGFLKERVGQIINDLWEINLTPKMVIATPDCDRSFYLDFKDGSQKWESFIITELLPHLKEMYRVEDDQKKCFIGGISMGGMGALRMGFKYPLKFEIILAFEPGIEPALEWKDVKLEDKFWRDQSLLEERYGKPIDENYWRSNNPASIVSEKANEIRESNIKIYIEAGTEDMFGLFRGTEFLHRILYDHDIKHEYRYVYGADHIGFSLRERIINGFSFIKRVLNLSDSESNHQIKAARNFVAALKKREGLKR